MSAVQDEAYDGPEDLDSEDNDHSKELDINGGQGTEKKEDSLSRFTDQRHEDKVDDNVNASGTSFKGYGKRPYRLREQGIDSPSSSRDGPVRPSSADGSLSIPDDTPSIQGSLTSSPSRGGRIGSSSRSPTPSLRPFDQRFLARITSSHLGSSRATSPAFLNAHSRRSSEAYTSQDGKDVEVDAPWDVVRWTKLRKVTGQAFSEVGKRNFGRPTCIAVSASIALGTSRGIILVFDYSQNLKAIIGPGTKAVESGAVTSISISADHSTIAGGHASGSIITWDMMKPAKPFLHIAPVDKNRTPNLDGHSQDAAILHVGFLGIRHTALSSADDKGMAFSHLATRGMGMVARSVKTTRILGRYPEKSTSAAGQKKPSSVLSFSPLPLGNAEHAADNMGLVAMLTPYLLVIVSTMPIAQTQFKAPRPKEVASHSAMTAALAWFPSVKLKAKIKESLEQSSRAKLVYCWSNILTVLDVLEVEPPDTSSTTEPPSLQFKPRNRWKAGEPIVGAQWLSRSVLAVLTITEQLIILEDNTMIVTDSSDLIQKHIYHVDLFSQQLSQLVDHLEDEEIGAMHGVVADAFHMSFRAYKGRLFLLGHNEVSFGTLSNWADRLLALVENGSYIKAILLATGYYTGEANKVTVGLPEDDKTRHQLVQEKLSGLMLASLKYVFGQAKKAGSLQAQKQLMEELATACIQACISMQDLDFLFDEVYPWYQEYNAEAIFLEELESRIDDNEITILPPIVVKNLVSHYTAQALNSRLEEILINLDPHTMDIDQITTLCKKNSLFDALLYVWNQALNDYTTVLNNLIDLGLPQHNGGIAQEDTSMLESASIASKMFPYLSYIFTSRIYPTGKEMPYDRANLAKADLYNFFFSGRGSDGIPRGDVSPQSSRSGSRTNFPKLRQILNYDAPSFLSMLNEAFEDSFLNGPQERLSNETPGGLTEAQKFGLSVNRQWIVSILLEVMTPPDYERDDTIYLDMFIARNLPKYPQFILLPGHVLHKVLVRLCQYPNDDVANDCQLSVEYLLSIYQPPDLWSLIPSLHEARFYRVLKSVYKAIWQFAKLLQTCFEDRENPDAVFDCIRDCLKPSAGLSDTQVEEVRAVIVEHAGDLVSADVTKTAAIIDEYATDLHGTMLMVLNGYEAGKFEYLQVVLEPRPPKSNKDRKIAPARDFIGQYVRLMCAFDPSHVSTYVNDLSSGDLRLEEVLPALEDVGIIDAAVILMAREGKIREGIDRLTAHLSTLESAFLGLLDGATQSPDLKNTAEAAWDLIRSVQKYARVGVWICQGQTKAVVQSKPTLTRAKSIKGMNEALSPDEELWLDLIDAIVTGTKNATESLERLRRFKMTDEEGESDVFDSFRMTIDLRTIVQETFTALLNATTATHKNESRRTDISFLRILRAFLGRASLSSPSLANLRGVLTTIFSAYAYEEELLALSNRLLDKDLFVHVTEADTMRRRGWRPLGQVCEGCGKRVWGPGAGGYIWDAWQRSNETRLAVVQGRSANHASQCALPDSNAKGKAATRQNGKIAIPENAASNGKDANQSDGNGAIVIFSCRHMFHRACLEEMQNGNTNDGGPRDKKASLDLECPLCI
ncbi:MAG: hypothetical protein Q9164_005232 [Protoblastenia rupestris]